MSGYLDYAATTPTDERVIAAMADCMRRAWANPSAAYSAAGDARREMRLCRETLAQMLGCDTAELVFTSGGTESNTWAMQLSSRRAVSAVEHESVLRAAPGAVLIPADENGVITPEAVVRALRPDTQLVSIQWANNETGVIHPIRDIYPVVKRHGAFLHVDAVQAFGHIPVDVRFCDLLTLSAHKFYGPRGAGCLYIRSGVKLPPLLPGGGQQMGLRGGTENVPAICGMRVAAELAQQDMHTRAATERALLDSFLPPGWRRLCSRAQRVPSIAAYLLPSGTAEEMIARLDLHRIQISGGSACRARNREGSHVALAMGLSPEESRRMVRISIGRGVTGGDLQNAEKIIAGI